MKVRSTIVAELKALYLEDGLSVPDLHDDLILLDTDLDSLGFAVLVSRLDEILGADPFSALEEPVYPEKLGDLIKIYEDFFETN